ncbi:uncharacterized protein DNG_03415 [Cephalotrichum gorgonifer]|uniref:magnesium chelatase n=1 Tax=Cephalotrichum gorgonifer TaxID=2041049 RepID=A0AAE8MVW5_9PEZI|nr:uncharacterized protein DNG_03415 [Cephalotrichum gorgonifer]
MADEDLFGKAQGLSDLELAFLLCLMSREHCIISSIPSALDDLVQELQFIASKTFGLVSVVINCCPTTTLDDFVAALLLPNTPTPHPTRSSSPFKSRSDASYFNPHSRSGIAPLSPIIPHPTSPGQSGQTLFIPEVVLARNLDRAPKAVQIQALELLRTRRIFTRTAVQTAPKTFLFVPLLGAESGGAARVTPHLNDFFFLAHWHDVEDGLPYLEEAEGGEGWGEDAETASTASVVKRSTPGGPNNDQSAEPLLSEGDISRLASLSRTTRLDIDVHRYQMNLVSFLRIHRAVAGGISYAATKHFDQLMRCLAPLHGIDFVTPALVALAARKVYLHRIEIAAPAEERSVQWGSDIRAVEVLLEGIGPEDVIEDVLGMVTAPV